MKLPSSISQFNIYNDINRLLGISGEIQLPNLEAITETIEGAGIAGSFEIALDGQYGSMEIEIPFLRLHEENFKLMTPGAKTIVLRASARTIDTSTGQPIEEGLKITIVGLPKGLEVGKIGAGKPTETKNKLEVLTYKIELDGEVLVHIDKINFICIIDGVDVLAPIRNNI